MRSIIERFQSTLPHGSDLDELLALVQELRFQSTLPHGSDALSKAPAAGVHNISIHAPSRERLYTMELVGPEKHFNPRSLTGATSVIGDTLAADYISIHAPSRERLSVNLDDFF